MKTIKFFNKQVDSVNLQNLAASQIDNNLKSFIDSFTRNGFLTGYSETDYGFTIQQPTFTMGSQPVGTLNSNYLNISIANGNIFGINSNGDPLIINTNEIYQTLDITQDGGNINIPLTGGTKPYTNYIYIIYRQSLDKSQPSIDFDGNTNYPVNNHSYYIYVSTSNTYTNIAGLYCGSVTVNADSSQTYNYSNVSIAGIRDTAIKIQVPGTSRPYIPTVYQSGTNTTLRDHISAIGTNSITGGITVNNPHGTSAADIGAMDGNKLNSSNQFKNGFIIAPNSTILQLPFGATIYTPTNSIYLSRGNDGIVNAFSGFMYSGVQHYINEITPIDSTGRFSYVSFTGSDSQGWYLIYLVPGSVANTFQLYKMSKNPGASRQNGDMNIWLGFIYWNGTALCLNENNIGSTGNYILPAISYAWIDKSSINKEPSNFDMISQNLISNDPALYDITNNGKYTKTSGIASINMMNIGNVNWLGIKQSGSGNWETFSISTNQKLSLGNSGSNPLSFYTVSFNYMGNINASVKVVVGGQTYYLPSIITSGFYSFMVNGFVDSINFQIEASLPATIYLNNIQIYQGTNPTLNYIEPQTYTNEVIFDSTQSQYNVGGTLQKVETRIDKMNLDNILQLLCITNPYIVTAGIAPTDGAFNNYGGGINLNNLQLWIVRGAIAKPMYVQANTSATYETTITWGSQYRLVYSTFNYANNLGNFAYSGNGGQLISNIRSAEVTNVQINSLQLDFRFYYNGDSTAYGNFPTNLDFQGIMIMQKIS